MRWQRAILSVTTLTMFLVFLYTCYESVAKLQRGGIAKTIGSTKETINFPSVTVCNVVVMPGINKTFEDVLRAVTGRDAVISSVNFLTDEYRTNLSNFSDSYWTRHLRTRYSVYDRTKLEIANCYTFKIARPSSVLDELVFYFNTTGSNASHAISTNPKSLTLTIHEDDQLIYSIYDIGGMFTLRMKDIPNMEMGSTFQLQATMENMLSTSLNPCDPSNRQKLTDCIQLYLTDRLQCRLPWINLNSVKNVRVCNSTEDLWAYVNVTMAMEMSTIDKLLNMTGCRRNCKEYSFGAQFATEFEATSFEVSLVCHHKDIPVTTEVYLYTFTDFIADVGGYLGLLIGASVLTLVEYVLHVARIVLKKINKKKTRKNKDAKH